MADNTSRATHLGEHRLHPETLMLGYGYDPALSEGAVKPPVFLTSTFVFRSAEQGRDYFDVVAGRKEAPAGGAGLVYSRFNHPNAEIVEDRLAIHEGAEAALLFSAGMSAIATSILAYARPGDAILHSQPLYGGTETLLVRTLANYDMAAEGFTDGLSATAIDAAADRAMARGRVSVILVETPSNPMLDIVDLQAVADLAHQAGALVVVDNVFATPLLQKPFELGADVVVYSCTKHIDGQGRVLGGAVLGRQKWIDEVLQPFIRNTGPSMSAFNAWLLLKGIETLALRVDAGCRSAEALADHLARRPEVARVWYPTRADHPQQKLAMAQMSAGGTLVTFEVAAQPGLSQKQAAFQMMNALNLIRISNNLGDSKSLATHPATTTHLRIGAEERKKLGITDGVIRLSVGLEDIRDLQEDLDAALQTLSARAAAA